MPVVLNLSAISPVGRVGVAVYCSEGLNTRWPCCRRPGVVLERIAPMAVLSIVAAVSLRFKRRSFHWLCFASGRIQQKRATPMAVFESAVVVNKEIQRQHRCWSASGVC